MTDGSIVAIVTAVSAVFTSALTGFFGLQVLKIKKTTDTTLQHVNHERIVQAQRYAVSCRINADLSHNEGYQKIADAAEAELASMIKSQAQIDQGNRPIA